jgi:hypothetical protein
MTEQNKPKRQRYTKKFFMQMVEENRQVVARYNKVTLNSIAASKKNDRKRSKKNISGESSKKQKTEAPSSSRNAEVPSSVVNDHSEDKEATTKISKHYEEQKKLLSDWDLMKELLIKRYYMSFASEADLVEAEAEIASLKVKTYVDPRVTEVKHLSPCSECESFFSAKVKVYFLNSKISGIIAYQSEQIAVY